VAPAAPPPGDLLKLWRCPPGSSAHLEFAFSCMGHEIPAGLGIRLADPAAGEVLVVIGDGTYLMAPTELVTAAQERLKVTVVVLVNGGFQSIHQLQRASVGRSFGTEFRDDVDYAANAESLGCAAFRARTAADLEEALDAARAEARPCVVECHVDPVPAPASGAWWDLGVPEASGDDEAMRAAERQRSGAARRRHYG
jgi:3D-(3,5/4)-trihydroxycyclohexane-1,2-dione acylhydrolase (decyclizing)